MVYTYDNWVQLPTRDLYDTQMMAMAVNAAKDMYEKSEKRLNDFYDKYGEFISPFAKDMERYGEMIGNVRDKINWMYDNGIDPLRSSEGRTMVAQLSRSIDPAEFNTMRSNAKTGYAYLDAMQKLRSQGKYSEAQELFDIAQNNGINFADFSTRGETGLRTWDRTSPIEATTLRDLTQGTYKGRTARLLSQTDFDDPGLAGKYKYDPNYEWSGYLYSDLLKGAPGASLSLAGDPRAAFFRDQARQKVIAMGQEPTTAAVEAQFQRDIADANTWALIDPTRTPNQFALDDYRTKNDNWLDAQKQSRDYKYNLLGKYDFNLNGKLDPDEVEIAKQGKSSKNKEGRNYLQEQFDRGMQLMVTGNIGVADIPEQQLDYYRKKIATSTFKKTKALRHGSDDDYEKNRKEYLANTVKRGVLSAQALTNGLGRVVDKSRSNCVWLDSGDIDRLYNEDAIVTGTLGARRKGQARKYTDRSKLNEIGSDKLKMQFTDDTYTAPITYEDGTGRMEQYQKVKVYATRGQNSNGRREDYLGEYWFKVQEGRSSSSHVEDGKRVYDEFSSSPDDISAGYMQSLYQQMEKWLGATSNTFTNSETRLD